MTDKHSFLDKLNAALVERGISDADIAPYIERFDRFYDRMVSDSAETSKTLEDIDAIADKIASQISDRYDDMNRLAERTMTMNAVKIDDIDTDDASDVSVPIPPPPPVEEHETVTPPVPEMSAAAQPRAAQPTEKPLLSDPYDQPTAEADISEISEMVKTSESSAALHIDESEDVSEIGEMSDNGEADGKPMRLPDYVEEEPLGDTKTFYIIFFSTLPLTIPLALFGLSLFLLAWAVIGVGIALAVAALVATAAAGSLLSVIGVVYGVIRLFDTPAVGLYEIGLGVTIGGIVILACILMYNLAIRLLPYLMKLVLKLLKFVVKKLKELFKHLRKESAKL